MTKTLKGIAASDGIGIAKAYCLVAPDLSFQTKTIADSASEVKRLEQALQAATSDLTQIRDKALANLGQDEAAVFEAHMAIFADPDMVGQIKELITTKMINAEAALQTVTDQFITIFDGMTDNPYMQERSADVKDVTKRVLSHLLNRPLPDPALIDEPVIIVAHDLTPSETAQMNRQFVKGFLTDLGGRTSHSAIMSRTLEIPAVVGTENATQEITTGMSLIVDGLDGLALVTPTATELAQFKHQAQEFAQERATWQKLRRVPTVSQDGKHVVLAANVGTPDDSNGAVAAGAEAIGLFRTEFLYMNSDQLPSEDAQFAAYKKVVMAMHGKPVVIRTMDIGGDKPLTYLPLPKEMNPFLGYRAIRISLDRQEIFRTQLRALIRAANYGEIRIMFPMIATLDEFRAAKQIFNEEQQRLVASGVSAAKTIQLGMMVEISASAISADQYPNG